MKLPLIILCFILLMRLLAPTPENPLSDVDSSGYDLLATNLLNGHGFTMNSENPYCPDTLRTPVYPMFLAGIYHLFGRDFQIVFIFQSLLDVITAVIVYRLTYSLSRFRPRTTALFVLVVYGCSLSQWHYANLLLTESLLTCLLALSVWFYWLTTRTQRKWYAVLCGVLLALAVLCKPNYQWMLIAIPIGFLMQSWEWRKRVMIGAIVTASIIMVLMPWLVRNHQLYGRVFLSQTYQENLARVSAVATLAESNGEKVTIWSERWEVLYLSIVHQTAETHDWGNDFGDSCAEKFIQREQIANTALGIIRANPMVFAYSHIQGVMNGLVSQEQLHWYEQLTGESHEKVMTYNGAPIRDLPLLLVFMGFVWLVGYVFAYIGAIIGIVELWRYQRHFLFIITILLIIGMILPGSLAWVRFRVPITPYWVMLYGVGWMIAFKARHKSSDCSKL